MNFYNILAWADEKQTENQELLYILTFDYNIF